MNIVFEHFLLRKYTLIGIKAKKCNIYIKHENRIVSNRKDC